MTDPAQAREAAARVMRRAPELRALGGDRVSRGIAAACARLRDPRDELGARARAALPASAGLSTEMVEWALATALPSDDALARCVGGRARPRDAHEVPARLAVVVLAGNVFTACVRALLLPLLAGVPVVAKASSRDGLFADLLAEAVQREAPDVGGALEVLRFGRDSLALDDALFAQADVVSVYGNDRTIAELRGRTPGTTTFVAHGHGLGAAWVPAEAALDAAADELALDVAAYDQRGCLSPHAVWTTPGQGGRLAEALHASLGRLAVSLPRGPLPATVGAAQVQWRGVAGVRGELREGDGFAVARDHSFRVSPGYRNVAVLECGDERALGEALLPLGAHLKALGVAAEGPARRAVAEALPPPLSPRVSRTGRMQTPPLDALADGQSPWLGLLRYADLA